MTRPETTRQRLFEVLAVFLVAILARTCFLFAFKESSFFVAPILDSAHNDAIAKALARGDWLSGAPYFRPPLFPWLLGGLYELTQVGPWPGRLLNALCGCATSLAVLGCGWRLGLGRNARLAAALATALYAPELFLEGELLAEPLAGALGAWSLFAVLGARTRSHPAAWILPATLAALAALARAPLALLAPSVWVLALLVPGLRVRRSLAVLAPILLIWSIPASIMAAHGEGFRFPATQGGINFAIGNHPDADGRSVVYPPGIPSGGWSEFEGVSIRVASRASARSLSASEASSYWYGQGLAFWRDHPVSALQLTAKRVALVVHGNETPNNRSLIAARQDAPILGWLMTAGPPYLPGGLLWPLALMGLLWVVIPRRTLWLPVAVWFLATVLPLTLFFVCARFRTPALAPAVLLAVLAVVQLRRAPRTLLGAAAVLVVFANVPWPGFAGEDPAHELLARGESAFNASRFDLASVMYEQALSLKPGDARAILGLASVAAARGQSEAALAYLNTTPDQPMTWTWESTRARVLDRLGRGREALPHAMAAARDFPENPVLQAHLGLLAESLGEDKLAMAALESAADRGTQDAEVWNSLGRYRRLVGDSPGAMAAWNRAILLDSEHFKARYNRGLSRAEAGDGAGARADLRVAVQSASSPGDSIRAERALETVRTRLP